MNIFEGARRISFLITGLIAIGFAIAGFDISPTVNITYDITIASEPVSNMSNQCVDADGAYDTSLRTTKKGTDYLLRLCFLPAVFDDGEKLVPYKIDADNLIWGARSYSAEVVEYTKKTIKDFSISEADEASIDNQWLPLYLDELLKGFFAFFLTVACFWVFVIAVGWIVRGFMGIPRGRDKKPIQ
jgi:hypothetical protein